MILCTFRKRPNADTNRIPAVATNMELGKERVLA